MGQGCAVHAPASFACRAGHLVWGVAQVPISRAANCALAVPFWGKVPAEPDSGGVGVAGGLPSSEGAAVGAQAAHAAVLATIRRSRAGGSMLFSRLMDACRQVGEGEGGAECGCLQIQYVCSTLDETLLSEAVAV